MLSLTYGFPFCPGNDDINDSSDHVTYNGPFVEPNMNDIKLLRDLIPAENSDPSFLAAPESITVQEGEPLRFSCRVTGTAPIGMDEPLTISLECTATLTLSSHHHHSSI